MKLSFEQIKNVTVGALWIEQKENGIAFHKCTAAQEAAWRNLSEGLGTRSETTTGIRLDFHTDSETLVVDAADGDKFEVYINGLSRYRVHAAELRAKGEKMIFSLGKGEKRVTLIFPNHGKGVLTSVELDDGATLTPHTFACRMLFIGDSITQGWNSRYDSLSYAWRLTNYFDANSVIQGIGGAFYHESTLDKIDFDPDTVVIAYGTNDFGRFATLDELRGHAALFLDGIKAQFGDKRVFVITPIYRADWETPKKMGSFAEACAVIAEEGQRCGFTVVDGQELVPHNDDFMADAVHPNDLGFGVYAENMIKKMI
ncbi:MAG: SGNH/GDSL hydrolase family protein [Ruminococcaceae bacterium]|nr:SGNH/GDSL hydrolase family protein [Oscillospiraceae bacterium]